MYGYYYFLLSSRAEAAPLAVKFRSRIVSLSTPTTFSVATGVLPMPPLAPEGHPPIISARQKLDLAVVAMVVVVVMVVVLAMAKTVVVAVTAAVRTLPPQPWQR